MTRHNLPEAYQEVEWIQSTWPQYMNLAYKPKDTTRIQFKYIYTNYSWNVFIWTMWNSDNDDWRFFRASNVTYFDMWNWRINWNYVTSTSEIYETEIWNYYVKNLKTWTNVLTWTTQWSYTKTYDIQLFYPNTDYWKIYYVKIYEWATLVRDFIPCYKKSDNVIGLYDLVGNQFYTNSWTGTFTKWPNIEKPIPKIVKLYNNWDEYFIKEWEDPQQVIIANVSLSTTTKIYDLNLTKKPSKFTIKYTSNHASWWSDQAIWIWTTTSYNVAFNCGDGSNFSYDRCWLLAYSWTELKIVQNKYQATWTWETILTFSQDEVSVKQWTWAVVVWTPTWAAKTVIDWIFNDYTNIWLLYYWTNSQLTSTVEITVDF